MYLDDYDPFAIKLYSKCAKSQAQKFSHKKMSQSSHRPQSSMIFNHQQEKKKKSLCTFEMSQSRQQRERKYKRLLTPAVGQYNPRSQKKVKLTWDILKIYHNRTHSRVVQSKTNKMEFTKQQTKTENCNNELEQTPLNTEIFQGTSPDLLRGTHMTEKIQNLNKSTSQKLSPKKTEPFIGNRLKSQNSRYKTIRSQVDMSRMTGRQFHKHYETEVNTNDLQVSRSIEFIKNKTAHNIDFQKQISRQKIQSLSKPINVPSDYSYDIGLIKPKWSKVGSFYKSVGREQANRSMNQQVYGYTHYDYDKYVWSAKSNIFVNTKTNVTDFKKQTHRNNKVYFKRL